MSDESRPEAAAAMKWARLFFLAAVALAVVYWGAKYLFGLVNQPTTPQETQEVLEERVQEGRLENSVRAAILDRESVSLEPASGGLSVMCTHTEGSEYSCTALRTGEIPDLVTVTLSEDGSWESDDGLSGTLTW